MNAKKHTPLSLHGLRLLFPPLATLGILFLTEWIARGSLIGETFTQYIFPHAEAYLLAWAMLFLSWLAVDWLTRFAPLATLLAAVLGALFVGCGVGLSVRAGGAPGGDDALAMSISKLTRWDIQWAYLISDLVVLALSATYIDLSRLGCSLLTVILSGQIIGLVQRVGRREDAPVKAEAAVEEQL